jgi:hypothetical protein
MTWDRLDDLHASALQREHVWTPTKVCYFCGTRKKHATSTYCAGEQGDQP